MGYRAPLTEMQYYLTHVLGADRLAATELFSEATPDMIDAILTEAARLSEDVLAPLNRAGDETPARLENGFVRTSPGYAEGYRAIAEGGWTAMTGAPDWGGMGLPQALSTCVVEMMSSACLSLALNPLMTQGQIEALEHHASDALKDLYLPKLNSGQWTGTMNLTEPQAGSDVGALRSRAEDNGDGTYAITGQKIYISWGDHDVAENVCHLVLARLPDGVPGTKGISLFLVPKYLPDAAGNPGAANSLKVVSLEHKMGLHGSPTCVMQYDGATGWMVGAPHGGMAAMFTMMNNARLGVGVQGLSQAEAAYQHALAYAMERTQGRSLVKDGTGTILDHADVRRMLMTMKALTAMARAICLDCALSIDLGRSGDAAALARAAVLTPIAKAFGTDTGCRVAELGVQVHGGMGYIEETGAAQYYRDVRVTAIYEGTNGIQAMDLVGRKMMSDGGAAIFALLDAVVATAAETGAPALADAAAALRATTRSMLDADDPNQRFAGAVPYLRAFALVLGGHYLQRAGAAGGGNRAALARFALNQLLPEVHALCAAATAPADDLYALSAEALSS
ncbi:acyl-CoA dehydrogenase family protein [Oceanibium sediminis]|uniref:acyl-CoA dehydrogenase family protein n=1 Tax=Oceanibium sediminis TaxID=2026339 RepID=UPI000DD422AE|nr:acyl-CoA dehydrogenase family protein [Oceanibium sediminis]